MKEADTKGTEMAEITWQRISAGHYAESTGRFEILRHEDMLMGGESWFIYEIDESPMDIEPRETYRDAKQAAEATIRAQ